MRRRKKQQRMRHDEPIGSQQFLRQHHLAPHSLRQTAVLLLERSNPMSRHDLLGNQRSKHRIKVVMWISVNSKRAGDVKASGINAFRAALAPKNILLTWLIYL